MSQKKEVFSRILDEIRQLRLELSGMNHKKKGRISDFEADAREDDDKINAGISGKRILSNGKPVSAENEYLRREISSLKKEITDDLGKFRVEYDNLNNMIRETQKLNSILSEKNSIMRKKLMSSLETIQQLRKQLQKSQLELKTVGEKSKEIHDIEVNVPGKKAVLETEKKEHELLMIELKKNSAENVSFRSKIEELHKGIIIQLQEQKKLKDEIKFLKQSQLCEDEKKITVNPAVILKKNESLKKEINSLKKEIINDLGAYRVAYDKVTKVLEESRNLNATLTEKNSSLRKRLMSVIMAAQKIKKELLLAQQQIHELKLATKNVPILHAKVSQGQAISEKQGSELEQAAKKLKDQAIENTALKSKVDNLRSGLIADLDGRNKLKEELLIWKNKEANARRSYDAVLKELRDKKELLENMNETIALINSRSKIASSESFTLISKNEDLIRENDELRRLLDERTKTLEKKEVYYPMLLKLERQLEEERTKKETSRMVEREVELRFIIEHLTEKISEQNLLTAKQKEVIEEIRQRERNLILEFNSRFKEVFAFSGEQEIEVAKKINKINAKPATEHRKPTFVGIQDKTNLGTKIEKHVVQNSESTRNIDTKKLKEVIDIVAVALQHKDTIESIHSSLINSGYDEIIVKEAISKINRK